MATIDSLRKVALALPGVEEGTSYGALAFKSAGRVFACIATNKSAEPGTLMIRMDDEQRDELIAADPEVYYLKEHYAGYHCVLIRLAKIHSDALRDLLAGGRRFVLKQKKK